MYVPLAKKWRFGKGQRNADQVQERTEAGCLKDEAPESRVEWQMQGRGACRLLTYKASLPAGGQVLPGERPLSSWETSERKTGRHRTGPNITPAPHQTQQLLCHLAPLPLPPPRLRWGRGCWG